MRLPLPEKAIIEHIRRQVRRGDRQVLLGIGDDAAVVRVPAGDELLVTTDFTLEGTHFRRQWHAADAVGHRCLARGLSDIAAMGGEPIAVFLSLAAPARLPQSWVDGFMDGLLRLARRFDVTLAGGDTAESPAGIVADIVVLGSVRRGQAIRRSRARPGDRLYVTGTLGGSASTLEMLFSGRGKRGAVGGRSQHFYPMPRIVVGRMVREKKLASAMIDISDGLSTDLRHICEESGVGAEVFAEEVPRARIAGGRSPVALELALHGGDDYELLFTAPQGKRIPDRIAGVRVTEIGKITRGRRVVLQDREGHGRELKAQGWQHFKS